MKSTKQNKQIKANRESYHTPKLEEIEIKVEGGYMLSEIEIPDYGDEEEW